MTTSPDSAPARERPARGALVVGRPFGIPVEVAPSWFLVAAFITVAYAPAVASRLPGIGAGRYVVALAFAVLLYLSVLVHELSHSLVARQFGLPVRRISIYLLGGVSEIEREPETPGRELLIAAAGPALSAVLAGLGAGLVATLPEGTVAHVLSYELAVANVLVTVFNLLPGLPLDGGRVLRAAVWQLSGRPLTGTIVAAWAGRAVALIVIALPLAPALLTGRSPSVIGLVWAAFLASFIWMGASAAEKGARLRERLPALRAGALARKALAVPADLPLTEGLRRAHEAGARALVVIDRDGRPTAIVSEAAVTATPEPRRPWVAVGALARSVERGLLLDRDLAGMDLVATLERTPASEYLVVGADDAVHGVLAADDVARALQAR